MRIGNRLHINKEAYGESRRLGHSMPRRRFILSGLLAICASLGIHYTAFKFAEFSFSALDEPAAVEEREKLVLHQEDMTPLDRATIAQAFAPANPDEIAATSATADPLETAIDAPAPELEPIDLGNQVDGFDAATIEPVAPVHETRIDPRREIVKIDEKIFEEEVEHLPRRLIPDVPREIEAPDITFDTKLPDLDALQETARVDFGDDFRPPPLSLPPLSAPPAAPDLVTERAATPLAAPATRPDLAAAGLTGERPDAVTKHEAVEQLLALKVSQFTTPEDPEYVYFKISIERNGIEALPVLPKAVILLQDCSLSITEAKLEQFKLGLYSWLETIRPGDYFNVIAFSDGVRSCFPDLVRMDAPNRAAAKWFISNLKTEGKTDVFASLQTLLRLVEQSPVPVVGILLTDGRPTVGLRDSTSIIERFTQAGGGRLSVFCVGGGSRANEYMLDLLSYRNRGDSILVPRNSALPGAMENMAGQLRHPVLANLQYTFTGAVEPEVYPFTLTHLYLDRPLEIFGRVPRNSGPLAVQIVGQSIANRTKDMIFRVDPGKGEPGPDQIRKQWAWHKMYHLIGAYLESQDPTDLHNIRVMAARYNLRVPYVYDLEGKVAPVDIRPGQ